jgi:hypothetical protein
MKTYIIILLLFVSLLLSCGKKNELTNNNKQPKTQTNTLEYKHENQTAITGFPSIGKWMFDSTGTPSTWLGKKLEGKIIREAINIIIVDSVSKSVNEAKQNLIFAFDKAGYKNRWGHSSGYKGLIDSNYFSQLPEKYFHAFSTHPFEFDNNHGRIFGPYFKNGVYYFTGALSREKGISHDYISFTQARDNLAASLDSKTAYKLVRKINLNNTINSDSLTTGDHDGYGILISVSK